MRGLWLAAAVFFASLAPALAVAQSTAAPVVTGYLTTSGCPPGSTSCFAQYGAAGPSGGTVTVTNLPATVDTNTGAAGASTLRVVPATGSTVGVGAGSAIIGKVGIDQTTPGTTNGVQVNAAVLPSDHNTFGTPNAVNGQVTLVVNGAGVASIGVTGNTNVTLVVEGTADALTWTAIPIYPLGGGNAVTSIGASVNGEWVFPVAGLAQIRARVTVAGATPASVVVLNAGAGSGSPLTDSVGNQRHTVCGSGSPNCAAVANPADAQALSIGEFVNTQQGLFGGTTYDREREASSISNTGIGVASVEEDGRLFKNITTAATTTVKSGAGYLHEVCINKTVASATISMFDNTAGSGTSIGVITMPASLIQSATCFQYDIEFSTGLTLTTVGAQDITVSYR